MAYYLSPPTTIEEILADPFHAVFYVTFILVSCALFSKLWINISGSSAKDVARQFDDQGVRLSRFFSSISLTRARTYVYPPTV